MNVHLGNIIVAGRGGALVSQRTMDGDGRRLDLKFFRRYLLLCEQLQFLATAVFIVAVATLSFYVFDLIVYPIVLLVVCVMLSLIVFCSTYWKVSMTSRNLMFVTKVVCVVHRKMGSYWHHRSS